MKDFYYFYFYMASYSSALVLSFLFAYRSYYSEHDLNILQVAIVSWIGGLIGYVFGPYILHIGVFIGILHILKSKNFIEY